MLIEICRSKIQNLRITGKELDYEGSITLGKDVLKESGLFPGEKVQVLNKNNGVRFETYIIEGNPGEVILNGPAARCGEIGDILIVLGYGLINIEEAQNWQPKIIQVNEHNSPIH